MFTGLKGAHDFKDDGSMVSSFDLENFFVRSYKPGPESIVFSDPTSVVRNEVREVGKRNCGERSGSERSEHLKGWVLNRGARASTKHR